jgi:Mrp family chromosome partitioning ATPase
VDFLDYVKLFRRKWQIVVVCVLVGAFLGWFTAPDADSLELEDGEFFEATAILKYDAPGTGTEDGSEFLSLADVAFMVQVGPVPRSVAAELATSPESVQEHVRGTPLNEVDALAIEAIGEDAAETVQLADVMASQLATAANQQAKDLYNAEVAALNQEMEDLQGRLDVIRADPDGDGITQEELDESNFLYSALFAATERYRALIQAGVPANMMTPAEQASAILITEQDYNAQRERNLTLPGSPEEVITAEDEATEEATSTPISASTRGLMGAFLGLFVGVGIVLVVDRFDTRLRTKRDAEEAFSLPVIAELPPWSRSHRKRSEIMARTSPRSRIAEAYRAIRTSILFVAASGAQVGVGKDGTARAAERNGAMGPRPWLRDERGEALTVLVSSPGPEEGKTSTTANLAALLAEMEMRVLVVNCDYRRPRIHRYFEGREVPTPSVDERADQMDVIKGARIIDTAVPGVRLVTGIGENDPDANPAQVVAAQRKVVEVARRHFDVILLDTAPLLTTNDAVEVLSEADLVVLTCRYGKTKREQAVLASELLERLSAPVVGVVFVESPDAPQAQYYYYYLDPSGGRRERRRDGSGGDGSDERPEATVTSLRDASGS